MSLLSFRFAIRDLRHAVAAHATTLMALILSGRFFGIRELEHWGQEHQRSLTRR